jgi:hypothetical protein
VKKEVLGLFLPNAGRGIDEGRMAKDDLILKKTIMNNMTIIGNCP